MHVGQIRTCALPLAALRCLRGPHLRLLAEEALQPAAPPTPGRVGLGRDILGGLSLFLGERGMVEDAPEGFWGLMRVSPGGFWGHTGDPWWDSALPAGLAGDSPENLWGLERDPLDVWWGSGWSAGLAEAFLGGIGLPAQIRGEAAGDGSFPVRARCASGVGAGLRASMCAGVGMHEAAGLSACIHWEANDQLSDLGLQLASRWAEARHLVQSFVEVSCEHAAWQICNLQICTLARLQ